MDTKLTGRVALVLGATSGLGLAVARSLAAEGARVALVGRRAELATEIAALLPDAIGIGADIEDAAQRQEVIARVTATFGPIDVLLLNGGGPAKSMAADFGAADVQNATGLLVGPAVEFVRAVLPSMRSRQWGRIIAVGSSAVQQPIDGLVGSSIGRSALAAYLKTLASEVAAEGVTVNMVLPGRIHTDRTVALDTSAAATTGQTVEEVRARSFATIPMQRYGTPEEFAAVVTFLASADAAYVTGEQIRCDGGLVRAF